MRRCAFCAVPLDEAAHAARTTCSKGCRQAKYRLRLRRELDVSSERPIRCAYADPPYPGTSRKYYSDHPDFAGEVDHRELIEYLRSGAYDGWALSTSEKALRELLPLCPEGTRVCPWVKPHGVPRRTRGLHNCWEPLLVFGGRQLPPGRRDWLMAHAARGGGDLPGRKPLAFCGFLFDALGLVPGDELVDLYPGTGMVGRAFASQSAAVGVVVALLQPRRRHRT